LIPLQRDKRADPADRDNILIRKAAIHGIYGIVEKLLTYPAVNPAANNSEAIRECTNVKVVRLLLQDGRADPSANDDEAIRNAIQNGQTDLAKVLSADRRVKHKYTPPPQKEKEMKCCHGSRYIEGQGFQCGWC
jgi:hypothetical protein